MAEQKGQSFLKGTVILTAATFVVKFINIFFSIPLANFLGGEGMGHFYTAYDIFIFFSVLATSGTPVAISRMVSMAYAQGRKREADKIFRVSFLLFSVIGMAGCLVMVVFARQFSLLMTQATARCTRSRRWRRWCSSCRFPPACAATFRAART